MLYWFRSPPHVKIGRAAFDEDAIRALEEQHPDVEFDWDRILITRPPVAPDTRDPREARPPRRPERRPVKEGRRDVPRPMPADPVPAGPAAIRAPESFDPVEPPAVVPAVERVVDRVVEPEISPVEPAVEAVPAVAWVAPEAPSGPAPRRFVRVYDAASPPAEPPPHHATELSVVERMLGTEQLTVLRARYAEILARISARGGDPGRVNTLRDRAASIDPDGWVTETEVTAGLAAVEATLAELHQIAGRRRRRRRRDTSVPRPSGGAAAEQPIAPDSDTEDDLEESGPT